MKKTEWKAYFDSTEFETQFHTDAPLGAFCWPDGTRFALWAPTARRVALNLYREGQGGEAFETIRMKRGERGVFSYETRRNLDGVYYDYDVSAARKTRRTADPYARAAGVNGVRSMVIDLSRTDPPGWEIDAPPPAVPQNVIYELHVKDFSWDPASGVPDHLRGKYLALTLRGTTLHGGGRHSTCLDHIRGLGVTHVQLMPIYDYGSVDEAGDPDAFNWGYDPVNYNVPEGSYATDPYHGEVRIRELKQMIMALHEAGLRVIMDVVYNHTYHLESPLFNAAPWYYLRQKPDGSPANGSGCGTEIASERSMCARYILDSVLYWASEYHIDGFRFDLMGLHDVELMNGIRAALDARFGKGEKLVYGEPWSGGRSFPRAGTMLADKGHLKELRASIGAFCDNTRDAVKGSVMDEKGVGFVNGGVFSAAQLAKCIRAWAGDEPEMPFKRASQTISYLSCHDDWTLFDKLVATLGGGYEQPSANVLRANRLAAAMLFCCQGHLFFLSGEEFARTKLGVKNSYCAPVALNRMDWARAWEQRGLVEYYRGFILLRRYLPGLSDKSIHAAARVLEASDAAPGVARIRVQNESAQWGELVMLFNTTKESVQVTLPQGCYVVLADGEDSFLWQTQKRAEGTATVEPVACLLLGKLS